MLKDFFKVNNNIEAGKGRVLISEPLLDDYYFKRSIIIITEHNAEGTIGFVINNSVEVRLSELLPEFPEFDANISIGGPVSTDTLQFIHSLGDKLTGSIFVKPGLYWGGDFIELARLIKENQISEKEILFFLGYSGWSPNQLEEELKRDSWIVTDMSSENILKGNKELWKETLMSLGDKHKVWANFPDDPELN